MRLFPARCEHVGRLCDLLDEMGLSPSQISCVGRAVIGAVAANMGCGGVMPVPAGRGELRHDGAPS
jgi:hypothetical protein